MCDSESSLSEYLYASQTGHHPNFSSRMGMGCATKRTDDVIGRRGCGKRQVRALSLRT
jgi:hypothetical protein